jgi:hypothetical protein
LTQPNIYNWGRGAVNLAETNGTDNIVSITTNCNGLGPVTWWQQQSGGRSFTAACREFWRVFPFAEMGTNCASCVATELSPTGAYLQDKQFSFDNASINLFGEEE